MTTSQTPIVPLAAPAPLSAAPAEEPVSSLWPESMGERPSLRSAIAAAEIPAPTPPVEDAPSPEGEEEPVAEDVEAEGTEPEVDDAAADEDDEPIDDEVDPGKVLSIADLVEAEVAVQPGTEARRSRSRRERRRPTSSAGTVLEDAPAALAESDAEPEIDTDTHTDTDTRTRTRTDADPEPDEFDEAAEPRRKVNTLAVLALLIGILACPLAALFGHLALGQLKVSDERGVIPAWIAVVLGYLWLGFWIVFGITYFATNG